MPWDGAHETQEIETDGPATNPPLESKPSKNSLSEDLHEEIAKRAYGLYEWRIRQGALDDWLQAERDLLRDRDMGNSHTSPRGSATTQEPGRPVNSKLLQ